MGIQAVTQQDYLQLIDIWESSVRATHHFLSEQNIVNLKTLILKHYFDAVDLRALIVDGATIAGFIGVADSNVEMLFVRPEYFGKGIGRKLVENAINNQSALKVDVNEQNPKAIGFYERLGFNQVGRSPIDGQGNAFPLIHMALGVIIKKEDCYE
jgi:putative acetyltransferase